MGSSYSLKQAPSSEDHVLGVYFDRDNAGLSNLRLQLESMMAICKAFNRFLVLPPPQKIQHLEDPYHESNLWSMTHLSKHVPVVMTSETSPPTDAHFIQEQLASLRFQDLPQRKHWHFGKDASRIQHFETLSLPEDRKEASVRCVFDCFELNDSHHVAATRLLKKAGLGKYEYVSVHLRRGDFKTFRPQGYKSGEEILRSLVPFAKGGIVLMATDAPEGDLEIEKLKSLPGAKKVILTTSMHEEGSNLLSRAAIEMLICRWSSKFIGTQDSTFTTGIFAMRKKDSLTLCKHLDASPMLLFDAPPMTRCSGVCWNKITEYERV
jgi:hypothetical protein